jgi:hypothetical protein
MAAGFASKANACQGSRVRFPIERWLRVVWTVASAVFVGVTALAGVAMVVLEEPTWMAVAFVTTSLVGAWMLLRTPWIGVRYDSDTLTVDGALWSRRIQRHRIVSVGPDPGSPWVAWTTDTGRIRMTPLTPLWGNIWGWHAPASAESRRRYLKRLDQWARRG